MALRDYLEILWRRRLVVLLPVLAAVALAAAPALIQAPGYRSTTTLFFAPRDPSQGTALAGQRLASYVELVGGPRLAQGVAQQLDLPQDEASVKGLASRLSATAQPESLLVTVAATGASPQDAQRLAQTAASQLVQLAASLEPPATATQTSPVWLTIAEPAEPGLRLGRSALVQDVVLALVLGLAVGSALAFLADALDPRVADARGLRRIVPGGVLTLPVPRTDAGGETPADEPAPPPGAVRVLRTALLGQAVRDADHGARVLVVTGDSADGATSTIARWIATALTRSGRTVLLVRTAEQDGAEVATPGIAEVLAGVAAPDTLPLQPLEDGPCVLSLGRAGDDPGERLAAPGAADLIRQSGERFDHVVIEAPPVLPYVETALLAAQCADQVVLVVRPGWSRRRQVQAAVAVLAQQQAPVTLSVLTPFLRRRASRGVAVEVPPALTTDAVAPDAPAPVAPLTTDPLEGEPVAPDEEVADASDSEPSGSEPSDSEPSDSEPSDGDADADVDDELDAELDHELDEDSRVLSGGGPARGGDA